jgi:transcriptional regulator with XRE-family HTH domain
MHPPYGDGPTRDDASSAVEEKRLEQELAERLRSEREYLGLSQDQVARALELPRAAVSAFETGRRKVSSVELARLARLYGTTPDRLLGSHTPIDERSTKLFRATKKLSAHDQDQVLRFVEFLNNAATTPAAGSPIDASDPNQQLRR